MIVHLADRQRERLVGSVVELDEASRIRREANAAAFAAKALLHLGQDAHFVDDDLPLGVDPADGDGSAAATAARILTRAAVGAAAVGRSRAAAIATVLRAATPGERWSSLECARPRRRCFR